MQRPGIPWPPVTSDHVWVKDGGLLGRVITVEGDLDEQPFTVDVLVPVPLRRAYRLGELELVSWPSGRSGGEDG